MLQMSDFTQKTGRKPNLVCIGAQKAGTSWLYEMLCEHPTIWSPPFKELHFFDTKFVEECRRWTKWHIKKSVRKVKQKYLENADSVESDYVDYLDRIASPPMFNGNWYKAFYAPAPKDSCCIDFCPEYSCIPHEGVEFVSGYLKTAKFIYIIRDPSERAFSQIRMNVSRSKEKPQTKAEWMGFAQFEAVYSRGNYLEHIPNWMSFFESDRLLFLPFLEIEQDPLSVIRKVEAFAGLEECSSYTHAFRKIHKTDPIELPSYVMDFVRNELKDQRKYLEKTFGKSFCKLI